MQAAPVNALMAGLDPSDERLERRLRDSRGEPKVVGFDLTFSAPKSVSVLFAAADELTAGQLVAAHESAVRAALDYVEDEAVRVRRGNRQLAALGRTGPEGRLRLGSLVDLVRGRRVSPLDGACYVAVLLMDRALTRLRRHRGDAWGSDASSRVALPGD